MSDSQKRQAMPTGPERELQLYAQGLVGGKPSVPVPLHLLEQKAKEILEPRAYDYVAGGEGGEENRRAKPEGFFPRKIVTPRPPDRKSGRKGKREDIRGRRTN